MSGHMLSTRQVVMSHVSTSQDVMSHVSTRQVVMSHVSTCQVLIYLIVKTIVSSFFKIWSFACVVSLICSLELQTRCFVLFCIFGGLCLEDFESQGWNRSENES